MMRVLLIARYLQMVNHRKVMALAAQPGIELTHIAPRRWTDEFRTYEQDICQRQNYKFIALDAIASSRGIHRFWYWPPTLRLNSLKPDIIHLEEEPDSLVALETVLARQMLARPARLILFTWQNVLRQRRASIERLMRFVLRRTDHMIAGNQEASRLLNLQGFSGRISVIPQLGVDTQTFKPLTTSAVRRQLQLGSFVVGYVGRLAPEKGLDTLITAVSQLPDIYLLLVGRGPIQAQLEMLAQSLGMADRFRIVAAVRHHEVPHYLNAMDTFVLPSRTTATWKEQFGHVLIEAMACGVPVIGSDSGAIPEVIGSAGIVFPEGDVSALNSHLKRLYLHPEERRQLAELGMLRVTQLYTHECIAQQTVQIYRSVLDSA